MVITLLIIFSGLFLIGLAFFIEKKKNYLKNFSKMFLIFGSILFSIGLLEKSLILLERVEKKSYPPIPENFLKNSPAHVQIMNSILYVVPPGKTYHTFGHAFTSNSLGFREKEFAWKKKKNIFRILVFGDSFTFGVGIDSNHRYTNLLEQLLNNGKKKYEVLNFGVSGYSTDQEYDLMRSILKIIECDLVIIGFCCDDLYMTTKKTLVNFTNIGRGRAMTMKDGIMVKENLDIKNKYFFNPKRNLSSIPMYEPKSFSPNTPWYKTSRIYKILEKRTNININAKLPNSKRWNYALNEFNNMKKLTNFYNLPAPVVVLLNFGSVESKNNNFKNPHGELAQYINLFKFVGENLKTEGFHVIDTLLLFKKYSGMSMAISEWEFHPNYLGHYIYAKSIYDYLLSNNLT